jgi:hypothetical protein
MGPLWLTLEATCRGGPEVVLGGKCRGTVAACESSDGSREFGGLLL